MATQTISVQGQNGWSSQLSSAVNERAIRRALIIIVALGLIAGLVAYTTGDTPLAHWIWGAATVPVVIALAVSIAQDLLRGRLGVDVIAFLSMTAAPARKHREGATM